MVLKNFNVEFFILKNQLNKKQTEALKKSKIWLLLQY